SCERFDSKPILLWLQRDAEVTGNLSFVRNCQSCERFDSKPILLWFATKCRGNRKFIFCPKLSKLKLGLELKQKFAPKPPFLNNSNPTLEM
ncbi:MAG TPA: hypothetical protein PLE33_03485, partial [Candidatus Cloacimonas sp.]|nr:hypothetical protein [Candidatus Cloacimonas sp.]